LLGRDRTETERFVLLRSHYGFDSFYWVRLPGRDFAERVCPGQVHLLSSRAR